MKNLVLIIIYLTICFFILSGWFLLMGKTNTELSQTPEREPEFVELATHFNDSIKIIGEYGGYHRRSNGQSYFDSSYINLFLIDLRNNSFDTTIFVGLSTPNTLEEFNRGYLKATSYGPNSLSFSFYTIGKNVLILNVKVDFESNRVSHERLKSPGEWSYITRDREILYAYNLNSKVIMEKYQKRYINYFIVFENGKMDTITSRLDFNYNCGLVLKNEPYLNCLGLNIDTTWVESIKLIE